MKVYKIVVVLFFYLFGCTAIEKPEFVNVTSVKLVSANKKEIILQTDLQFLNKNRVGGKIKVNDVKVFIDTMEVAKMQTTLFDVPNKSKFLVPIKTFLPYHKVFVDRQQNLLGNIMNMVMRKKVLIKFKGDLQYQLGSFYYNYPFEYSENILIEFK